MTASPQAVRTAASAAYPSVQQTKLPPLNDCHRIAVQKIGSRYVSYITPELLAKAELRLAPPLDNYLQQLHHIGISKIDNTADRNPSIIINSRVFVAVKSLRSLEFFYICPDLLPQKKQQQHK